MAELITTLRAIRAFDGTPVPRAEIEAIVDEARWTGSARNRQPWRFAAVTDPALREALAKLGQYARPLASAPTALLLLSDPGAGADTEFDLGRVCQSVLLCAHARALATCPVTLYPDDNAREAARLAGFPPPWLARHAVAIGHPGPAVVGRSAVPTGRKPVGELLTHVGGTGA
ncbi:nitroreductase family protein [Amycolatopsis minnesotensis]|uniref:Nitroreductase n=1 Tax=Amycolatopsis minnesotensis TaxID=337894 RepID=A0ABN2QCM2_9PSEU